MSCIRAEVKTRGDKSGGPGGGGSAPEGGAEVATEPEEDPVFPEDLATTVYKQLGIIADKELMAPGARPVEIVDGGKVINEIVA